MSGSSLSYDIVMAVSQAEGVTPSELIPLHDVVDPDALDALFDDPAGPALRDGHVSFIYEGYVVEVDNGEVTLTAAEQQGPGTGPGTGPEST